jgi:hypothetical protein
MKKTPTVLILLGLLLPVHAAERGPQVVITALPIDLNRVDPCGAPAPGDAVRVEVRDGAKLLGKSQICTSYGKASGQLIRDGRGDLWLALKVGEGHGTNAVTEYLDIVRVAPGLDERYARTPVSGAATATDRWEYKYTVTPIAKGGIRVDLVLAPGSRAGWLVHPDKRHVIEVSGHEGT